MDGTDDGPERRTLVDRHGVRVVEHVWEAPAPHAVVYLSHGVGEHARRYDHVARALRAGGYTVVADDHLGHGETGLGDRGLGHLGRGGNKAVFDQVEDVARSVRATWPGLPVVALGHSWGSLIVQKLVARDPALYDAVVLTGTSLAMPGVINGGDLNKRWRAEGATGFEWLSRDPEVAVSFRDDPLTFDVNAIPPYTKVQMLQLLGRPPRDLGRRHDLPVLVQGGSEDSLGGVRGMTRLVASLRGRAGLSDVSLMIYPGARHEVFNETVKAEVLADLVSWLDSRFAQDRTRR
ncbi:alpha/beta fold hydrolase [Luteimicrobium subarcticum]|uniref:Alpha-beta hydrolase superfamily lysophospholipase n=1 Tax=Luteimicrobium subarcticum TaxID=620910 RepID=A0A2M8W3I8_9MICO|nr:alpha/beta fold hydrolase [Luteimicrobium subarcticum]PJI85477.1 alpha-beta hydrolase superfamily lysophospholipase [Luteimicrobium subarcticum]